MRYPGTAHLYADPKIRHMQRIQDIDNAAAKGGLKSPLPPRAVQVQSSSRGFLLSWNLPAVFSDIVGWRIYKDTESQLYGELRDRGTRQYPIETSSGASPSKVNVFVSSLNARGVESPKIQIQGIATAEAGAPSVPGVPTSFTGINRSSGFSRQLRQDLK